jgi:hypothetical protein
MAARALIVLADERFRRRAHEWIDKLPKDSRVTFEEPKRSLEQNKRLWAHLTDIACQATHNGLRLSTEDWKTLFMDALNREARMVPNLDGNGMVNLGRSSSRLSVSEMGDLIMIIEAWCARESVTLTDPTPDEAAWWRPPRG